MHNNFFVAGCVGTLALIWLQVPLNSLGLIVGMLITVCLIGVPHGGLDHLSGRQWLSSRWGSVWFIPFFVCYLAIAVATIVGWLVFPVWTAIGFFMISANHFGRDDRSRYSSSLWRSLSVIGLGGLVIWIPAIARPVEMQQILQAIIPREMGASSESIVFWTQILASVFVPIAMVDIGYSLASQTERTHGGMARAIRQTTLVCMLAATPIPLSFCLYFCGWHSIRGLNQLMHDHDMTIKAMTLAVLPLSLGAIGLCGLGMWFWNSGRELNSELTRTLFLGLSGMAVPHLVLHDLMPMVNRRAAGNTELLMQSAA